MVELIRKQLKKDIFLDYTFITIGCILMGFGIGVFLVDAKVVPGVGGLLCFGTYPFGTYWHLIPNLDFIVYIE